MVAGDKVLQDLARGNSLLLLDLDGRCQISRLALGGQVAQLVEQGTENPCVGGSNPPLPIL